MFTFKKCPNGNIAKGKQIMPVKKNNIQFKITNVKKLLFTTTKGKQLRLSFVYGEFMTNSQKIK